MSEVEAGSFVNPDGSVVLVLLNRQEKALDVTVKMEEKGTDLTLAAHTITTIVSEPS
ncbi:MAG: glycoside hydrolase family 30 beta sandwich domain-containing protein [Hespellia sp.]|nr:glycoside hydrolase family 30 beta sandwich domain-containing protein [Hespellia sp.]